MPRFGELEAAIMDAVWESPGPVRVREVLEKLQPGRELAYNTVQTVMEILRRKGWLTKDRDGRAHRYTATAGREEYVAGLMDEALAEAQDRTATLARFFEGIAPGEADELSRLLRAAKADREAP